MKLRLVLVIAIALGGLLTPQIARADESLSRARQAFDKAQSLYATAKYAEAAVQFQAAYDARPFAQFLFNIGACHEKLRDYDKAVELYQRYIKDDPKASDRKAVEKRIGVLQKESSRLKTAPKPDPANPDAPEPDKPSEDVKNLGEIKIRGLVVIESDPPGALIYLDSKKNKPLSKTPWNGTLEGEHTLFIEKEGYKPIERSFTPDPNQVFAMVFGLAEQDYLGWVEIKSNVPGADIYVDSKDVGVFAKTPYSGNIKPGKHKIWVTTEGYNEYTTEIEIIAGETHEVNADIKGSPVGWINVRGKGVDRVAIYADGKLLCERGPCRKPLPEGTHEIKVKRSGYKTYTRTLEVQAKTETIMRVRLSKEPGRADAVWAYIFSAGFLGGGIYLGLQANSIEDEIANEIRMNTGQVPPDSEDPRLLRGKLFAIGADAAYALAGVTALTAIYYTFREKGQPSTGSLDVRAIAINPTITPSYAGMSLELKW